MGEGKDLRQNSRKTCGEIEEPHLIVIASAAKQSRFLTCCTMDCFATLAMTVFRTADGLAV
jgi:hypothetical protein